MKDHPVAKKAATWSPSRALGKGMQGRRKKKCEGNQREKEPSQRTKPRYRLMPTTDIKVSRYRDEGKVIPEGCLFGVYIKNKWLLFVYVPEAHLGTMGDLATWKGDLRPDEEEAKRIKLAVDCPEEKKLTPAFRGFLKRSWDLSNEEMLIVV